MEQAQIQARKIYEEFDTRRKAFDAAQADEFDLLELEQETKNIKK